MAVDFLVNEVVATGVRLELGIESDKERVKEIAPDVVVLATGSRVLFPEIKGLNQIQAVSAQDVLLGKRGVSGQKILVIGGGMVGVEVADFLAERGKKVTVVEMAGQLASGKGPGHWYYVRKRLRASEVETITEAVVEEVGAKSVVLRVGEERRLLTEVETIVVATGVRPRNELADQLKGIVPEIHVIGDAREARNGLEAVLDAMETALRV